MTSIANHKGEWLSRVFARGIDACGLAALLLGSGLCQADEVEKLSVTHSDGEYRLEIVAVLDAPADYTYNVITDYPHAYRINPSIVEVEILPTDHEGVVRVHNRSEHWVGPFCIHIDWTGDITSPNPGQIEVFTDPQHSSFESGYAMWKIRPQGERTLVQYASKLKPKFFIPPVIGDMIIERHIREDTLATFRRIECDAKLEFELDFEQEPEQLRNFFAQHDNCIKPNS